MLAFFVSAASRSHRRRSGRASTEDDAGERLDEREAYTETPRGPRDTRTTNAIPDRDQSDLWFGHGGSFASAVGGESLPRPPSIERHRSGSDNDQEHAAHELRPVGTSLVKHRPDPDLRRRGGQREGRGSEVERNLRRQ